MLKYFGVCEDSSESLFNLTLSIPRLLDQKDHVVFEFDEIEHICGYEFKNKAYLVHAFTHPSHASSCSTEYQKLEFLGDAILGT